MVKIEINEDRYVEGLVLMVQAYEKRKLHPRTTLLVELLKRGDRGYVVIDEVKEELCMKMMISSDNFDMLVLRMGYDGSIRREAGILYFAPKYLAIIRSEGNFLVSERKGKKSLGDRE